ncbi:MAG TPA: isochorismate synthase [Polyangiaceae bacterium]
MTEAAPALSNPPPIALRSPDDFAPLRDFVRKALAQSEPAEDDTVSIAVPAPLAPIETLFEHAGLDCSVSLLWAPPGSQQFAGVGAVHDFRAHGEQRFLRIRELAAELWPKLQCLAAPGIHLEPRLWGGFAFQVGRSSGHLWRPFGEAWFVLPRLGYSTVNGSAVLSLAVTGNEARNRRRVEELLEEMERAWRRLLDGNQRDALSESGPPAKVVHLQQGSFREWAGLVEDIRGDIQSGHLEKVVLARRTVLELSPDPEPVRVLRRLRSEAENCTRFAFRSGDRTFVGASPEGLALKRGLYLQTEAVAGSTRAGGGDQARWLLESPKELWEHAIVVRELLSSLSPLTSRIDCPERPEVRSLRYVLHLRTPIQARLRESYHLLELVERLHPTPAVGGVPAGDALDWIRQREPDERGWYAGPVGWFDAAGDGEFSVALRSGLLEGPRAHVYVGAGIVRDSGAESEYAETQLKLISLLSALGAEP